MEAVETRLGRALTVLTERQFPLSRGLETRIDAYFQLEELQRLEDSEVSISHFQRQLSRLLDEVRFDLEQNTISDVLHAALRCLSYFMHHRCLAASFPDDHVAFFLGELVRRLFSTSDQNTYKLCLWCLTMQNFAPERHKLLPVTVEGSVQAIVNPFQSRAIQVQALKGLRLLIVKYPDQVGVNRMVLNIYIRPIASRLSSGETSTRTQARLVLEEASKHLTRWSQGTLKMIQDCTEEYVLPAMKINMDRGHLKDAICLWKLALRLLRSKLSADLHKMNQIFYVPENCMEDRDPAVRLMAMHAWAEVIHIFRTCQYWLFNKSIVGLLSWPFKLCLEKERLLTVLDAAFATWRTLVNVAVQDFNDYCKAQQQYGEEGKQKFIPEWRFWFGELVINPLLTRIGKSIGATNNELDLKQFVHFVKEIWEPITGISSKNKCGLSMTESSSNSVSSVKMAVGLKRRGNALEVIPKREDSHDHARITSDLFGVALLLEDIFGGIWKLSRASGELDNKCAYDLAVVSWEGMSQRIFSSIRRGGTLQASKLGLRLVHMSLNFSFGILSLTSVIAAPLSGSRPKSLDGDDFEDEVATASVEMGLKWQLQLLASLMSNITLPEDLQVVMLLPKCKVFDHIAQRMKYLDKTYIQCAAILKRWNDSDSEVQMDFSTKSNGLSYLMMNLLFEYAIFVDDKHNNNEIENKLMLLNLDVLLRTVLESIKLNFPEEIRAVKTIIRFGEEAIRAAYAVENDEYTGGKVSMLDKLVTVCMSSMELTNANQQNASLLCDVQNFSENLGVAKPDASTFSSTASFPGDPSAGGVQETEFISPSLNARTSSLSLMSPQNATIPSSDPVEHRPEASADVLMKDQSNDQQQTRDGITCFKDAAGAQQVMLEKNAEEAAMDMVQTRSIKCHNVLPTVPVERSLHQDPSMSQCIYPNLVGCMVGVAALDRHVSMGFGPLFSFYRIKTIGELSALSVKKVETFGLKDPVSTVRRALEEFDRQKERMKSSMTRPFRLRSGSTSRTPEISMPSQQKLGKRHLFPEVDDIASSFVRKRGDYKRTKRSLVLDTGEGKKKPGSGEICQETKVGDRVTLCLLAGDTGGTRITRPGEEDSQDQWKLSAKVKNVETVQEEMNNYTLKLLQHLKSAVYYMDQLAAGEESIESEVGSLPTSIATVDGVITNYHEAHELVSRLASQLQLSAETSSTRCRKLLNKCGRA
ncbi:hypothetical protein PsorP6_012206 [Peronosclerospora sorghi]|uniref:Uncharacterized protein n=1 Tax=Peronosclerospora sorghi TaxID=230839 RepID=A0ACC0WL72_9STRA|nr:hypothetical protein PsorP6_012206 [Peronosclerospora sorghi]